MFQKINFDSVADAVERYIEAEERKPIMRRNVRGHEIKSLELQRRVRLAHD